MNKNMFGTCLMILLMALSVPGLDERYDPLGANLAIYPVNHKVFGPTTGLTEDESLPRNHIHSIYKFGYCVPAMLQKAYLRKTSNLTMTDYQASQASYIYLLEMGNTQRFRYQCVVMRILVPRKFMFLRGRIPMLYCQGILRYVYLLTFQKIEIHEFYLQKHFSMPAIIEFEFYHGTFLERHADGYYDRAGF